MSLATYWTIGAQRSFNEIDEYLLKLWEEHVADVFAEDVTHTIALLEIFPNGGVMEVANKGIRSIPVGRHVRLFYRFDSASLIILEFSDTRTKRFQSFRE